MLPTKGHFKDIICPYFNSYQPSSCPRPYCHFKHAKKTLLDNSRGRTDVAQSSETPTSSTYIPKPKQPVTLPCLTPNVIVKKKITLEYHPERPSLDASSSKPRKLATPPPAYVPSSTAVGETSNPNSVEFNIEEALRNIDDCAQELNELSELIEDQFSEAATTTEDKGKTVIHIDKKNSSLVSNSDTKNAAEEQSGKLTPDSNTEDCVVINQETVLIEISDDDDVIEIKQEKIDVTEVKKEKIDTEYRKKEILTCTDNIKKEKTDTLLKVKKEKTQIDEKKAYKSSYKSSTKKSQERKHSRERSRSKSHTSNGDNHKSTHKRSSRDKEREKEKHVSRSIDKQHRSKCKSKDEDKHRSSSREMKRYKERDKHEQNKKVENRDHSKKKKLNDDRVNGHCVKSEPLSPQLLSDDDIDITEPFEMDMVEEDEQCLSIFHEIEAKIANELKGATAEKKESKAEKRKIEEFADNNVINKKRVAYENADKVRIAPSVSQRPNHIRNAMQSIFIRQEEIRRKKAEEAATAAQALREAEEKVREANEALRKAKEQNKQNLTPLIPRAYLTPPQRTRSSIFPCSSAIALERAKKKVEEMRAAKQAAFTPTQTAKGTRVAHKSTAVQPAAKNEISSLSKPPVLESNSAKISFNIRMQYYDMMVKHCLAMYPNEPDAWERVNIAFSKC